MFFQPLNLTIPQGQCILNEESNLTLHHEAIVTSLPPVKKDGPVKFPFFTLWDSGLLIRSSRNPLALVMVIASITLSQHTFCNVTITWIMFCNCVRISCDEDMDENTRAIPSYKRTMFSQILHKHVLCGIRLLYMYCLCSLRNRWNIVKDNLSSKTCT